MRDYKTDWQDPFDRKYDDNLVGKRHVSLGIAETKTEPRETRPNADLEKRIHHYSSWRKMVKVLWPYC